MEERLGGLWGERNDGEGSCYSRGSYPLRAGHVALGSAGVCVCVWMRCVCEGGHHGAGDERLSCEKGGTGLCFSLCPPLSSPYTVSFTHCACARWRTHTRPSRPWPPPPPPPVVPKRAPSRRDWRGTMRMRLAPRRRRRRPWPEMKTLRPPVSSPKPAPRPLPLPCWARASPCRLLWPRQWVERYGQEVREWVVRPKKKAGLAAASSCSLIP